MLCSFQQAISSLFSIKGLTFKGQGFSQQQEFSSQCYNMKFQSHCSHQTEFWQLNSSRFTVIVAILRSTHCFCNQFFFFFQVCWDCQVTYYWWRWGCCRRKKKNSEWREQNKYLRITGTHQGTILRRMK